MTHTLVRRWMLSVAGLMAGLALAPGQAGAQERCRPGYYQFDDW
jgi:hypothetical protein